MRSLHIEKIIIFGELLQKVPHSTIVVYRKEVRARNKLLIVDITRPPASSKKVHLKYQDIFHPSEQNSALFSE